MIKGGHKTTLIFNLYRTTLIIIFFLIFLRIYFRINKPNRKYFALINFNKPTNDIIKKATKGILNSEKTEPFFVHVAPMNDEIEQLNNLLAKNGFAWLNGKPGDGKTMLAYHTMFTHIEKVKLYFGARYLILFERKWKCYNLLINKLKDDKDIDAILEELDYLKGGKRKIILIDDAHKIGFEEALKFQFKEEAKEKLNGKFIWVNTNYLDNTNSQLEDSINIEFNNFYPKLLDALYDSKIPIIKEIVKENCSEIDKAKNLKAKGKINDSWHFNFVATKGELRIKQLLEKLSTIKSEQDTLLLSVFLFSVRNVLTDEKEINSNAFTSILSSVTGLQFKKNIENYTTQKIINDLTLQEKGRFIIVENKSSLDKGYLKTPHFKMSIEIIKSICNETVFSDTVFIKQIIDTSDTFFNKNFIDCKYFYIFFNALNDYQTYFLEGHKSWITEFLTDLVPEQFHVYPGLISILKKSHNSFYLELLTDDYLNKIATKISSVNVSRFSAIQQLLTILGSDKIKLIEKLDIGILTKKIKDAELIQFKQIADFIIALGVHKEKLFINFKDSDWETFAKKTTIAEVTQFSKVAYFLIALEAYKEELLINFKDSDWETFAKKTTIAEVTQFKQVAAFLTVLGPYKVKLLINFKDSDWETFADKINSVTVNQLGHIEAIITAIGEAKKGLIYKLNWGKLAFIATKAEANQLAQVADFIIALKEDKKQLIEKLTDSDWEIFAEKIKTPDDFKYKQATDFIIALGENKNKLIEKFKVEDWELLANKINKTELIHLRHLADFINALGDERKKLSNLIDSEKIIKISKDINKDEIASLCLIIASLGGENQTELINKIDWMPILKMITLNHSKNIHILSNVLYYQNKKQNSIFNQIEKNNVTNYLTEKEEDIIKYATIYYKSPNDFSYSAKLLNVLIPYPLNIVIPILKDIKTKIITGFDISPRYYKSFSNLLNATHKINSAIANEIITNSLVKNKLYDSFENDVMSEQIAGLQNLLTAIRDINQVIYDEIISLECIKKLNLTPNP